MCGLGSLWGDLQKDQDSSLVHELAFFIPFPMKRYLFSQDWGRHGLVLPECDVTDFIDSSWEASPSSEEWMEDGVWEMRDQGKEGQDGELGFYVK